MSFDIQHSPSFDSDFNDKSSQRPSPIKHSETAFPNNKEIAERIELATAFDRVIAPSLVELGALKSELDREDPRVKSIEQTSVADALQLIDHATSNHPIRKDLHEYYDQAHQFISGGPGQAFREWIENAFTVNMHGAAEMAQAIAKEPNTLIVFNHYNRGPEINGFFGREDLGAKILGHDMTPIIAQILAQKAFDQADLTVTRFGRPLFKEDDFYYRACHEIGHRKIGSDGVAELRSQILETWARGEIPTLCPEAGLRSLRVWRSGAVVAATIANARTITVVAECPWISLMKPTKDFHYVASIEIPDNLRSAVHAPEIHESKRDINEFNGLIRATLGQHIVKETNFSPIYRKHVEENLRLQ